MAIVTTGSGFALDYRRLDLSALLTGNVTTRSSSSLVVDYGGGDRDEFGGIGVTYSGLGEPVGGTITGYKNFVDGSLAVTVTGIFGSAAQFMSYVNAGNTVGGVLFLLSGDDQISGSAFADYAAGGAGNDILTTFGGDDALIGNDGNDTLNGGAGIDTALYGGSFANFVFSKTSSGWSVTDRTGSFGGDALLDIEYAQFTDKTVNLQLADAAVTAYEANILRSTSYTEKAMLAANGAISRGEALSQIIKQADTTTSVATLSYQFFTGKMPSQGGVDYLVSTTGGNVNNLNSAYYQSFNLENRYINFAVNLGKEGEGKAGFFRDYGSLSLFDATKVAYAQIFGSAPTDAKTTALLSGGRDVYFEAYGRDGLNGIGTKAAMVGWLLAEAEKADIGTYAKSNAAFLTDLADGATFGVDLIGVYAKPEYAYLG